MHDGPRFEPLRLVRTRAMCRQPPPEPPEPPVQQVPLGLEPSAHLRSPLQSQSETREHLCGDALRASLERGQGVPVPELEREPEPELGRGQEPDVIGLDGSLRSP